MRILIPSLCSLGLFVCAFVFVLLPQFEEGLLKQKKNTARNMTQLAWGILADYQRQAHEGLLTEQEARTRAVDTLRNLRYGPEGKDYFWISTVGDFMVMHPYRADLDGKTLVDFKDPKGKRLFVEFVRATEQTGEAFVDYWWQWKDDPSRIVPKLSYVKRYDPWGWIVGTGVYLDDIEDEAGLQARGMIAVSAAIGLVILLLTAYSVYQALKADKIIRDESRKYSALIDSANDGILLLQGDVMIRCNRKMTEMLGYRDSTDVVGRTLWSFSPTVQPDGGNSRSEMKRRLQLTEQEEAQRFTWQHLRTDGTLLTTEISLAPVRMENGIFVQAIVRDITGQLEAQEKLRLSEEKFRGTFDQTLQLMGLLDPSGRVLDINKAALDFAGICLEDVRGKFFWETTWWTQPAADQARLTSAIKRAAQGETVRFHTIHTKTATGQIRHVDFSIKPVFGEDGTVQLLIPAAHDITELIQAQQQIRRSQEYTRSLLDSLPSIVVGVDAHCRVTQWNRGAEQATGIPPEQARGKDVEELLAPASCVMENIRATIREGRPHEELRVPRVDEGATIYEDIFVSPLQSADNPGAVVRIDNVTQRVRLEEMMVQTEKMISVGGLAAGMAHEINNPLGIILQCVQSLERRFSPALPANAREAESLGLDLEAVRTYMERRDIARYMTGIKDAGLRAASIVANMLNFSRKSESQRSLQSMTELLDRTVELAGNDYDLKKKYDFRQIDIRREYEEDLPQVDVTETEIEQVILNLLKNAAQAMAEKDYPEGERPAITLKARRRGQMVEVRVQDNGPGMDSEERKRVFEPFYTTKKPGVGTGLGLSVSYFIVVESHGGEFFVESTPGRGAEFVMRIPAYRAPEESRA